MSWEHVAASWVRLTALAEAEGLEWPFPPVRPPSARYALSASGSTLAPSASSSRTRRLGWAHLLRDFTAHSEGMGEQAQFGAAGLVVANDLFNAWQQFQHDGNQATLRRRIKPLQTRLRQELEHASRKSARNRYHRQFARNLLKRWPALWTFSHTHGVEPTNNHAERGLRGAVIHRKLSLGSQSDRGERSTERLLSASITCRLRHQSLFAYLTQVITAHARGDPIPSLS